MIGAPWLLAAQTMRQVWRRGISSHEIWRQIYQIANQTAPLVILGMSFFGGVMVAIGHQQATKLTGNISLVGPAYFELLVRELGPLLSALLVASRVGAFHSAELASMSVNEQLEALHMCGGDILADLVAPRVIAGVLAVPLLCLLGTLSAGASAYATAQYIFGARGEAFVDPQYVELADIVSGVSKMLLSGLFIPLTSARHGLSATGGTTSVGVSVTRGVVEACMGLLVIDFLVALFFLRLGA